SATLTINNAAIGSRSGVVNPTNSGATTGFIVTGGNSIRMGIPSFYGSAAPTSLPAVNSPLLNVASTRAVVPATGARGQARTSGTADIGAGENSGTDVVAVLESMTAVEAPGASTLTVTITYYGSGGIDSTTIDGNDLTVTGGPAATTVTVQSKKVNPDNSV